MHRTWIVILAGLLLLASVPGAVAEGIPPMPEEFYGNVTINGMPAPAGILIEARINGQSAGSLTTTTDGFYGGTGTFDPRLIVSGQNNGQVISFFVGGLEANQTAVFEERSISRLDVSVISSGTGANILASTTVPTPTRTPVESPMIYIQDTSPLYQSPDLTTIPVTVQNTPTTPPKPLTPEGTLQTPAQPDLTDQQSLTIEKTQSTETIPVIADVYSTLSQPITTQSGGFSCLVSLIGIVIVVGWMLLRQ
jgi:hypothetical protein